MGEIMKMKAGIAIFGIVNIVLGIIPTALIVFGCIRYVFLIIAIFLFIVAGWVTDNEFKGFLDWFLQSIVERGSLIVLYIFSLFLFRSGLAMIRRRPYARKAAIVSIVILFLSWLVPFISALIRTYLCRYHEVAFDINALQVYVVITIGLLIYTLLLVRYLMNPRIKEYFNDTNVRFPLKRIFWAALVLLVIIFFGPVLQSLPSVIRG